MTSTEERGSFSHGICAACGWSGPGRRSRRIARLDADTHAPACPGHGPTTGPAAELPQPAAMEVPGEA